MKSQRGRHARAEDPEGSALRRVAGRRGATETRDPGAMKQILIFAPFWGQPGHVGHTRVERMIRWLNAAKYAVVVVRAGTGDHVRLEPWGTEVTVRDPLGLYRPASDVGTGTAGRRPNSVRRAIAYRVFCPDPSIVWAYRAASHPQVRRYAEGASLVVSSSPPESAHIGASKLARALGVGHLVDMRDGWLDEPLRSLIESSELRRWREARLESRVLRQAAAIIVTSEVWKDLLCGRLPSVAAGVHVVTNTYPPHEVARRTEGPRGREGGLLLLHAGRFGASRSTQDLTLLLDPLLAAAAVSNVEAAVQLIGELTLDEAASVESYGSRFAAENWRIRVGARMPRRQLLAALAEASGLLLLCASMAAVPSKLYEYIVTGRPILAVTPKGSATWRICAQLEQGYLLDLREPGGVAVVQRFLAACARRDDSYSVPHQYSEDSVSRTFLELIEASI